MPKSQLITLAFLATLATELVAVLYELNEIRIFSKGALMPLLMVYAFMEGKKSSIVFKLMIPALFFSWLGDILLLLDNADAGLFVFGLAAFLIAHVFYIFCYRKARIEDAELGLLPTQEMRYLFILVLAGSAIVWILFPHLGELKIPVIIYAIVLTLMSVAALYRFGKTSNLSFAFVFIGALMFMVSDSILAINKFVDPIAYAGFWVMLTYGMAQLLIVTGLVSHMRR